MKKIVMMVGVIVAALGVEADSVDVTVRRAPYVVSTVSSKSEKAWGTCRYCGSKISYDRTYRWDVYKHKWDETTEKVPEVCRSCKSKEKDRAKIDRKEAKLDRDLEYLKTKQRIKAKEKELQQLRREL